jgi:trehalose 6-phosphate synthase
MSRLVVVSNRVAPIQEGEATTGGLAAGVLDALRQKGGVWLGWSGNIRDIPEQQPEQSVGAISLSTIDLSRRDYDLYYRGFANGTLWPVLHYQIGLGRFEWPEYEGYRRVNGLFAQALAKLARADDLVWVHDYQLLHLAAEARAAGLTLNVVRRAGLSFDIDTPDDFEQMGEIRRETNPVKLASSGCAFPRI